MDNGEEEKFPDDLNEWAESSFQLMKHLFQKATEQKQVDACVQQDLSKTANRKAINQDDLTNLKIELSQINNIEDLLKRM